MLLIVSGEGPTDIGVCSMPVGRCRGAEFVAGPMTLIVDQIIESRLDYSVLRDTPDQIVFVSESEIAKEIKRIKGNRRLVALAGRKAGQETGFHMKFAWALGKVASEIENQESDHGITVFFRDTDGTHSNPGGNWQEKWKSIERGFLRAEYPRGVPMLPKPTSEAWLLAAAQAQPYQNCQNLEDLPGNEESPNHPKKKLDEIFGHRQTAQQLCDWLKNNSFNPERASAMPSFKAFHGRLLEVLNQLSKH